MAWLMPSNMIINTTSVVGYNNKLKQAVSGAKLGVNNEMNTETKKIGAAADGWRPIKSKPTKQPPIKPDSQSRNGGTEPKTGKKIAEASALR